MGKNSIEKNRKRYKTVAFRCSDEELQEIEKRIELSGMQKQEYLIRSSLFQEITVFGSPLLFASLAETLDEILHELRRIKCAGALEEETLLPLRSAVELLEGMRLP